jgi:hypothetical protein
MDKFFSIHIFLLGLLVIALRQNHQHEHANRRWVGYIKVGTVLGIRRVICELLITRNFNPGSSCLVST